MEYEWNEDDYGLAWVPLFAEHQGCTPEQYAEQHGLQWETCNEPPVIGFGDITA